MLRLFSHHNAEHCVTGRKVFPLANYVIRKFQLAVGEIPNGLYSSGNNFMSFHPQKIVLTSVESDHEDYYPTYGDILDAFVDYLCLLPENGTVIYCADDKGACEAVENARLSRGDIKFIPYGEFAPGDYGIVFGRIEDGRQYFTLSGFDEEFAVRIPGHHEVLDATIASFIALV